MSHTRLGFDAVWYELQAGTIRTGHGYVDPAAYFSFSGSRSVPTANFPPAWPTLLAVVKWAGLTGQRNLEIAGGVIGAGTVVLTGLMGRRIAGNRTGLVAAAIVAVSPFLIASDGSLMSDSLFTFLITAALLASLAVVDRPTVARWAVLGTLMGVAALSRGDGLVIAPFIVVPTALRAHGASRRARTIGAIATLALVVAILAPWAIRNSVRLKAPILASTNSAGVLAGANCDATYGGADIGLWRPECPTVARSEGTTEVEAARAQYRTGLDYIRDHAVRFAAIVAPVRVLRGWGLWNPVAQARFEAIESRVVWWQVTAWAFSLATILLAVPGTIALLRRRAEIWVLLGLLVGVTTVFAVSWGNQRFRLCAEPAIAVLAGSFVASRLQRRHREVIESPTE